MDLREAHAGDIDAIARLHAESWRSAYRDQYRDAYLDGPVYEDRLSVWRGRLTSPPPNQHTVVVTEGGVIVGFACAFADDDARWGTLLDNIHVDPGQKRAGIGSMLIIEVARWAAATYPRCGLYLWVLEANSSARRFYERHGGREAEHAYFEAPGGGNISSLRYAWPSPAALLAASGA
jgi:GNAT superfamily N-acetyltransferase